MDYDQAPRWGAAPEDEGDEFINRSKPKTRQTFLQRWMTRESPVAETEEGKDNGAEETPEGRKKKRFRKLFKKLFPSIAGTEKSEPEETPRMGLFAELIPSKSEPEARTHKAPEGNPEQSVSAGNIDTPVSEQVSDRNESPVEAEPPAEREDTLKIEADPGVPITPEQTDYLPPAPEVPPPIFTAPAPRRNYDPAVAVLDHPGLHNPLDRPPQTEVSKVENSKSSGALTAFLAAEFLSRRRARKIRKELKKLDKEVIKKGELKSEAPPSGERSPLRTRQEIQKTDRPESQPTPPKQEVLQQQELIAALPVLEAAPSPRAETTRATEVNAPAEAKPIPAVEVEEKKGNLKKEALRQQEALHSTELFLQQREQKLDELRRRSEALPAVEQEDRRKERDFDRRHEVLDESPKKVPSTVGAEHVPTATPLPSIGDVLRERINAARGAQSNPVSMNGGKTISQHPATMYQQSVQYGVGTALAIVVLAIVAKILL